MKRKKTFDCVEMKRRGAEVVQQLLAGMTPEEELAYWKSGTEELQQRQREVRLLRQMETSPGPVTGRSGAGERPPA